jgi:hypothetical protein
MTIILSDNLKPANTLSNTGTLELKTGASPSQDGTNFGQFMSEMFQIQLDSPQAIAASEMGTAEPKGQEVADLLALDSTVVISYTQAWPPLKAMTLGPHLNVLTPETSAPDAQSLEAFARAQGLDEQAVNWLFGAGVEHSMSVAVDAPALDPALEPAPALTPVLAPTSTEAAMPTHLAAFGKVNLNPIGSPAISAEDLVRTVTKETDFSAVSASTTASSAATAPHVTTALNTQPGSLTAPPTQISPQHTAPSGQVPNRANDPTSGLPGSALIGLQALWTTSEEPVQPSKTSTLTTTIAEEALPVQMLRMPPPAAVWIQRSGMNSNLQDKMNAPKESTVSTTALDLGPDWGGEILQEMLGAEASSNASSNSTGTHGTAYANFASRWDALASARNELNHTHNPAQDLPDTPSRSENIQNLADKMGQAVGQRILSEMERGQWHLKLQLRPATLGHIEVEMRMRSGEFDAIFTAPNAVTRDLLQDGLGKLRETLAQMGMDVANIHVGNGQTGQSGGDSTPGTPKGKTSQMATSPLESTAETPRTPRVKDPRDGLDILV